MRHSFFGLKMRHFKPWHFYKCTQNKIPKNPNITHEIYIYKILGYKMSYLKSMDFFFGWEINSKELNYDFFFPGKGNFSNSPYISLLKVNFENLIIRLYVLYILTTHVKFCLNWILFTNWSINLFSCIRKIWQSSH